MGWVSLGHLVRFEIRRWLGSGATLAGLGLFAAAHGLGWWRSPEPDHLFGYAFLGMLALAQRPALSADRDSGFRDLLIWNVTGRRRYVLGKLLASLVSLLVVSLWAALVTLALSRGSLPFTAWHVLVFGLVSVLLFPLVVAADLILGSRLPGALALAVAFLGGVMALGSGVSPETLLRMAGLDLEQGVWTSLGPLAGRSLVAVAGGWLLIRRWVPDTPST